MSEREQKEAQQETHLPLVDTGETLGLIVVPALGFGLGVAILAGPDEFVAGALVGGMFGVILARLRGSLYAVRTDEGIERKLRPVSDDSIWTRLAAIDYDEKYDQLLGAVCLLIGIGAFAAIPLLDAGARLAIQLVLVSFSGFVCALLILGTLQL